MNPDTKLVYSNITFNEWIWALRAAVDRIMRVIVPIVLCLMPALRMADGKAGVKAIFLLVFIGVAAAPIQKRTFPVHLAILGISCMCLALALPNSVSFAYPGNWYTTLTFFCALWLGFQYPYNANSNNTLAITFFSWILIFHYVKNFDLTLNASGGRLYGAGFDINYVGYSLGFLLLLQTYSLRCPTIQRTLRACTFLTIAGIIATGSRGATAALVFPLYLYLAGKSFRKIGWGMVGFGILLASLPILFPVQWDYFTARILNPAYRDFLMSKSLEFIQRADLQELLIGRGLGFFIQNIGYVTHNDVTQVIIELGIIYFIAVYSFIGLALCCQAIAAFSCRDRFALFCTFILLHHLFRGLASNFFGDPTIFYFTGGFLHHKIVRHNPSIEYQ